MATINAKFMHPTKNSIIDVEMPSDFLLRETIDKLIEANFINPGQNYDCVLLPRGFRTDSVSLNNEKTILDNGIADNDMIRIVESVTGRGNVNRFAAPTNNAMATINAKFIHPTNNSDIDIGMPNGILLRDVISDLPPIYGPGAMLVNSDSRQRSEPRFEGRAAARRGSNAA